MDVFTKTKNTICESTCQAGSSLVCGNEKKRLKTQPRKQLSDPAPNQQYEDCFVYASTRVATRLILKILEFKPIIVETENATFDLSEMCKLRCASIADAIDPNTHKIDTDMQYKIAYTHIQKYINDNVVNRFGCNTGYTSHALVWIIVFLFKGVNNINENILYRPGGSSWDASSWNAFEDFKDEALKTLILTASIQSKFNYVVKMLDMEHDIFDELDVVLDKNLYATFSISAADPWWTTFYTLNGNNLLENSAQLAIKTCDDETDTHVVTIRRKCQNDQGLEGLEIINSWGVDWANNGTFCFIKGYFEGIKDYTILFYQNYEDADPDAVNFTNEIILALEDEIKTIDALDSSQDDTQKDDFGDEPKGGKSRTHKRRRAVKSRKNMRKKARAQNKRTRKLHRNRRRNHTRAKLLSR